MIATIDAHNANSLLNTPEDTITDYFVSEYQVDPLVIAAREDVTVEVVPTKVDARYLPNRAVWDRDIPVPVDGTLVRVRVPFTGDPLLFGLQGSTWSLNPPQTHSYGQPRHSGFGTGDFTCWPLRISRHHFPSRCIRARCTADVRSGGRQEEVSTSSSRQYRPLPPRARAER